MVEAIKPLARATARSGSDAGLGGFGALFDLRAAGYHDPLLVATTDGVGTKLMIAIALDHHETVGIDLVAMCVNDLIVQGAEPLLFLDYFATGKLSVAAGRAIIAGIAEGCRRAGCALVGGETAELPGMYGAGDYDLAGFAVGAVERDRVLTGAGVAPGDVVLGLASSGIHSNGYSLVRRVVEQAGLSYHEPPPFDCDPPPTPGGQSLGGQSLGAFLLTPTRIYVSSVLPVVRDGLVKALAHITGGGLIENIPRVLPVGVGVRLDARAWPLPPVFRWLGQAGGVVPAELARTFNCGIGMVAIIAPAHAAEIQARLTRAGETVFTLGHVVPVAEDGARVTITAMESTWRD